MSKTNNLTDFLTDTANAIRSKKGTSAKINPQNFSSEISSINTSPSLQAKTVSASPSAQTVTADDSYYGLSQVTVNAAPLQSKTVSASTSSQTIGPDDGQYGLSQVTVNAASKQSKTVTPSTSAQTVNPDSGYYGLSSVTVDAISPTKGAQVYTPGTSNQTISSGVWLTGAQTIMGDYDLRAYNIKNGVNIFNVTGTYGPSRFIRGWSVTDSSTVRIQYGKTGYDFYCNTNANMAGALRQVLVSNSSGGDTNLTGLGNISYVSLNLTGHDLYAIGTFYIDGELFTDSDFSSDPNDVLIITIYGYRWVVER